MATALKVEAETPVVSLESRRKLRLHENILKDIVFKQAGTRQKAVLEAVMNCVDAGAGRIDISLDKRGLVVADDGRGFATREEIVANFETFGTPHEEGDATYGQYRMGRGQLFAFGFNAWRSGAFEMRVDAKKALEYDLHEGLPWAKGCRVDVRWYDEPYDSDLLAMERDIKEMVKYVATPVHLNGELVSKDPAQQRWDVATKDYFIKFAERGGLRVYNLGVFVREYAGYQFATGGTVVSRARLSVNFARNDVQSDCAVWRRIQKDLRAKAGKEAGSKRQRQLTDDQRQAFSNMLREGEIDAANVMQLRLLTDCAGRHWSINEALRHARKHGIKVITTEPTEGDHRADGLQQRKLAFVLSPATLERFEVRSLEQLLALFARHDVEFGLRAEKFSTLARDLTGAKVPVPRSEYTATERATLRVLEKEQYWPIGTWKESELRSIEIGESDSADAWTDGKDTIWLARRFLRRCRREIAGWDEIVTVLIHEYCHDDSTQDTHVHGAEFFEEFHRARREVGPRLLAAVVNGYPKALREENAKVGRFAVKALDKMTEALLSGFNTTTVEEYRDKAIKLREEIRATMRADEKRKRGSR